MKVEELYQQESQSQVGVTLQRLPFETDINIFPHLNPLLETVVGPKDDWTMTELVSEQTTDILSRVVKHQAEDGDDEFLGIPLKRIDSGAHQHQIQECQGQVETQTDVGAEKPPDVDESARCTHQALMNQIDNAENAKTEEKVKTHKKENTLSRMLKGIRGEKEGQDEGANRLSPNLSLSKLLHRMNPVGKNSRESVSKVFHRIGDALQKKNDERSQTAERNVKSRENRLDVSKSVSDKFSKVGEKQFKCGPPDKKADKAT